MFFLILGICMTSRFSLLLSLLIVLLLAGCGGGGGSSGGGESGSSTLSLTGLVVDPEIVGASVELRNAEGVALATAVRSDDAGRFSFTYDASQSPSGGRVIARGGLDSQTGYPFAGLTLQAPVTAGTGGIVVSPLSSLVVARMEQRGLSAAAAAAELADELGLPAGRWLENPTADAQSQLLAIRLSSVALALRSEEDPFGNLADALDAAGGDLAVAITALSQDATSSLTPPRLENVQDLLLAVDDVLTVGMPGSAAGVVALINQQGLASAIRRFVEQQLALAVNDTGADNIQALADTLLTAAGGQGMAPDSVAIANLLRYVLRVYAIDPAVLAGSAELVLPDTLSADTQISALIQGTVIDPAQPLLSVAEVGADSQKRLAYFYSSSLSPFYQAERQLDGVMDDLVADPVFTDIAGAQAAVGLLDEARSTLRTRIFQAIQRSKAARLIAVALAEAGRLEDAEGFFVEARDQLLRHVGTRENGVLTADDATEITSLSKSANRFGFTAIARDLLVPIQTFIDAQGGPEAAYTTAYGRVLTAVGSMASASVTEFQTGDATLQEALAMVTLYHQFVDNTGYQTTTDSSAVNGRHYKLKALAYTSLATYYDLLGQDPWPVINQLLAMDNYSSDPYISYVAYLFGASGRIDEYLARANAISTLSESGKQGALLEIRRYAALKALQEGADFDTVTAELLAHYPNTLADQANAMTWTIVSKSVRNEGWATLLFRQGDAYRTYGKIMLDRFRDLVQSELWEQTFITTTTNMSYMGRAGCAKVVNGYVYYGYPDDARAAFDWCYNKMVNGYAWTTPQNKTTGLTYLVDDGLVAQLADADALLVTIADAIQSVSITDPASRITSSLAASRIAALGGAASRSQQALILARAAVAELASNTATLQNTQINSANTVATAHTTVRDLLRARIVATGALPDAGQQAVLGWLNQHAVEIVADNRTRIEALAAAATRSTQYTNQAAILAGARAYDEARAIADLAELTTATRNTIRGAIASLQAGFTAFPGSPFASQDLDGDGLPDFLSPVPAGAAAINRLIQDDDIDGDGCLDSSDLTPFYASPLCEG